MLPDTFTVGVALMVTGKPTVVAHTVPVVVSVTDTFPAPAVPQVTMILFVP